MHEDPFQEELLGGAVAGQPPAPRAFHAPTTTTVETVKTYAPQPRPADGTDEQAPFWLLEETVRHNGAIRCPDCGLVLIGAHDREIARVGFGFLVCWTLQFPYELPGDVVPCHEGCPVACGRQPRTSTWA